MEELHPSRVGKSRPAKVGGNLTGNNVACIEINPYIGVQHLPTKESQMRREKANLLVLHYFQAPLQL